MARAGSRTARRRACGREWANQRAPQLGPCCYPVLALGAPSHSPLPPSRALGGAAAAKATKRAAAKSSTPVRLILSVILFVGAS